MTQKERQQHLAELTSRIMISFVLALGLLVMRQFTNSLIIIIAFWGCTLYAIILFVLWGWLKWQQLISQK
ncbi:hypothetical protein [Furfurilactobacillus curtus]|uniref:hypothetical protein n=1 Tax=Furfurilactobacillus curtus TaxID=1746200 RepID=UPI0038B4146F